MNDRDRLGQLAGLLDQLERMPASEGRDWMLAEVRGRAVDVETGVSPTPMRALPHDEAQAALASTAEPATVKRRRTARPRASRARAIAPLRLPSLREHERVHEQVVDLLDSDGVLSLDDAPTAASMVSRPWSGGLRG
jgi:hypothetical protein